MRLERKEATVFPVPAGRSDMPEARAPRREEDGPDCPRSARTALICLKDSGLRVRNRSGGGVGYIFVNDCLSVCERERVVVNTNSCMNSFLCIH